MSKMRSDCVFSKLTPEQVDILEGWLFEENMSYKDALERAQKEFGIESSLTGLRRFYGRLAKERNQESLAHAMSACVNAAALGNDEVLRSGLLTMANVCGVHYLMEPPKDIKQFTALMRALTSAQREEMKRIQFEEGEGRNYRSRVTEEAKKRKEEENKEQEKLREEVESREVAKGAKEEVDETELEEGNGHLSPALSPRGGEGDGSHGASCNAGESAVSGDGPSVVPLKAA